MSTGNPESNVTIEQLASITSGSSTWKTQDIEGVVAKIHLSDGPHGLRRQPDGGDHLGIGDSLPAVCFPPSVGIGSSWNRELARKVGAALGREARALDVQVLLGPGLNIKRSPLGGRNFEYFSEDPYVSGQLAAEMVSGIQSEGVAATPKHFAANNQETDRMRVSAFVSERALREIYLAAFEHVVKTSNPWAMMSSYNRINGVYVDEDARLITEILRDEWGFDGLLMSDWGAVQDRVAAVKAGLDLEMPYSRTDEQIVDAVREGSLSREVLDTVLARLQKLVERTTTSTGGERDIEAHQELARQAAIESITLLENDGVLPLNAQSASSIAVIGEFARTPRYQGGGSSRVVPTRLLAALDEIKERAGDASVTFAQGFELNGAPNDALREEAVATAKSADVALVFIGLAGGSESEGFDRDSIDLPLVQRELISELVATGTPVVAVLSNGGVVDIASWREGVSAVVETWLLGQEGGAAVADVLFGIAEPGGRLAESIPFALTDSPSFPTFPGSDGVAVYGEDIFVGYRGFQAKGTAVAYPFGYGLGYTTFEYTDVTVTEAGALAWSVNATVRNTGTRAGSDVVQLYVAPHAALPDRPIRELRGFEKVTLEPGESTTVTFQLDARALSRWNTKDNRWQVVAGAYTVEVGSSSEHIHQSAVFETVGDEYVRPLDEASTLGEWLDHPRGSQLFSSFKSRVEGLESEESAGLIAMARSVPALSIATWGLGFTPEDVYAAMAHANADTTA